MNKIIKIVFSIVGIITGIIVLDTIQAIIFKNSPIISWKETLEDNDSWVDKGILMDTYYCTKETDIVTVSWRFKTTKYTCPIDNEELIIKEKLNNDDITMTIKEGTLTTTSATIIITDNSGNNNTYGEYYRIEKYIDNNWQELEVIIDNNYGFNEIGYLVSDDNTLELTHNWETLYGPLTKGTYRLVKEVNNKYFSVSFTITNSEAIINDNNEEKNQHQPDNKNPITSNDDTSTNNKPLINNDNKIELDKEFIIKTITDRTKPNTSCAQAIEVFYEDSTYKYYYTCIKSQNIIVTYTNGKEENIKEALNNNHIKITDLDKYNIYYLKEKKVLVTR